MQQPKKAKILRNCNLTSLAQQGSSQGIPIEDWESVEIAKKYFINEGNCHYLLLLYEWLIS